MAKLLKKPKKKTAVTVKTPIKKKTVPKKTVKVKAPVKKAPPTKVLPQKPAKPVKKAEAVEVFDSKPSAPEYVKPTIKHTPGRKITAAGWRKLYLSFSKKKKG